ncbi:hypothetical protein DFH94DRAFT_743838 [Russula ochroleuca]|uniref:DUF6593 domain-containing protein n=1 Tax=Russula ochroleuca TaxID=152965 RepID=A0A9P5MV65_9AGAM|nr:hypothetical protein DFH94DRAFT_743838 [Russula ochroleuca]
MATASSTTQVSANEYLHRPSSVTASLATSLSSTLVDKSSYTERPSLKLSIPIIIPSCVSPNIFHVKLVLINSDVWSRYHISGCSNQTTLVSCMDNVKVAATVQWDHSSHRMVFRRKKIKRKAWLQLTGPQNESRMFTHGDAQFTWTQGWSSGHLIPANRPDLSVAQWHINPRTDELILEIFRESPVESDLLEAIVLSVVLLRSGRSLGDSQEDILLSNSGSLFRKKWVEMKWVGTDALKRKEEKKRDAGLEPDQPKKKK